MDDKNTVEIYIDDKNAVEKKPRSFPFKVAGACIAVIFINAIAIYLMFHYSTNDKDDELRKLGYETIKLSIQLLLIVLLGGIFIQEYNRRRARQTASNSFRRDVLRDLSRAYSDVKGVRRIIRAKCQPLSEEQSESGGDCVPLALYDEHIATINMTQLELEILVRELDIIKDVFDKEVELTSYIKNMEKYIKKVIDEYEKKSGQHRKSTSVPLSALPRLKAMVNKTGSTEGDFCIFADNYKNALVLIQEERIKIV